MSWDSYLASAVEDYLKDDEEELEKYEARQDYIADKLEGYKILQAESHARGDFY